MGLQQTLGIAQKSLPGLLPSEHQSARPLTVRNRETVDAEHGV
jgi:hypothetical protein